MSSTNTMISMILSDDMAFCNGKTDFKIQDEQLLVRFEDGEWLEVLQYIILINNWYITEDPVLGCKKLLIVFKRIRDCLLQMKEKKLALLWIDGMRKYNDEIKKLIKLADKKGINSQKNQSITMAFNYEIDKIVCTLCHRRSEKDTKMKKCSRCLTAYYCSLDCQKTHWKEHKKVCKQN